MEQKVLECTFAESGIAENAEKLLHSFALARVFFFKAEMGCGKTTLIKALCLALGSKDAFSSPTFSIINEYSSDQGPIYHMDLYRLKDGREWVDIGGEDYLHSGNYCFVEWPELLMNIREPYVLVEMEIRENFRYLSARAIHT